MLDKNKRNFKREQKVIPKLLLQSTCKCKCVFDEEDERLKDASLSLNEDLSASVSGDLHIT